MPDPDLCPPHHHHILKRKDGSKEAFLGEDCLPSSTLRILLHKEHEI